MEEKIKFWVGIDPGKDGAIVALTNVPDVPMKKSLIPTIGSEVDKVHLSEILLSYRQCEHLILEDVHSLPRMSAKSNFSMGNTLGIIEGVLVSHSIAYTKIQPKVWQKTMLEGISVQKKVIKAKDEPDKKVTDTKKMALVAAKRLFPEFDLTKSEKARISHDGIVDALLLADYCRRRF